MVHRRHAFAQHPVEVGVGASSVLEWELVAGRPAAHDLEVLNLPAPCPYVHGQAGRNVVAQDQVVVQSPTLVTAGGVGRMSPGTEGNQMEQQKRTCPACSSGEYLFRSRKKIEADPEKGEPEAWLTTYRCQGCGKDWRERTAVPA